MALFMQTLIPALLAYAVGLIIAWFIWGRDGSENA
jgi:hypothetical protein